jgi:hypothetical protein
MDKGRLKMGPATLKEVKELSRAAGCHWFDVQKGTYDFYDNVRWSKEVHPAPGGTIFIEGRTYSGEPYYRRGITGRRYVICCTDNKGVTRTYSELGWTEGETLLFRVDATAHRHAKRLAAKATLAGIIIEQAEREMS